MEQHDHRERQGRDGHEVLHPGQGVVAETLNLSRLAGYDTDGTIHIIANNQVGFTTDPQQGRSTRYSSDLAKGFEVPVVHVNADDPEACLAVARLAHAYRQRWGKDFLIDLVGYRRWGHNEGDEPLFTQPVMYGVIKDHPTARETLAKRLVDEGVMTREEADAAYQRVLDELARVLESLGEHPRLTVHDEPPSRNGKSPRATAVARDTLLELNAALLARPQGFTPNPRLEKVLQKRGEAGSGEPGIDWGHAEALAFASLLSEGTPVRLTGQDVERGTFSHRHAVLRDASTGKRLNLFHALPQARASFEIHNSPLSEMAVVGFEYGYSVGDPEALVLWEAQFGDFVNGAQVIIDQYLAASYQKWQQRSGLTLLLPHGYEGQGPEHSSARLERFLQLCAENNLRVANCTTSANYFHLLRRQAAMLHADPRPLVVMSPKSLLRHPLAASSIDQLAQGTFQPVIADAAAAERADGVTRLLLCSGKVYVDLVGSSDDQRKERAAVEGIERIAIARVEELYPFPVEEIRAVAATYPNLQEIVWVQEEPENMGAWRFIVPHLRRLTCQPVLYAGREEAARAHSERREPVQADADRQVRRSPDDIDRCEGQRQLYRTSVHRLSENKPPGKGRAVQDAILASRPTASPCWARHRTLRGSGATTGPPGCASRRSRAPCWRPPRRPSNPSGCSWRPQAADKPRQDAPVRLWQPLFPASRVILSSARRRRTSRRA